MIKVPATHAELLAVADAKLWHLSDLGDDDPRRSSRLFASTGDEIFSDDYECIESNDVLYVSRGEDCKPVTITVTGSPVERNEVDCGIHASSASSACVSASPCETLRTPLGPNESSHADMGNSDGRALLDDAGLRSMGVAELRSLIERAGLQHSDCIEKSELILRASEACSKGCTSHCASEPAPSCTGAEARGSETAAKTTQNVAAGVTCVPGKIGGSNNKPRVGSNMGKLQRQEQRAREQEQKQRERQQREADKQRKEIEKEAERKRREEERQREKQRKDEEKEQERQRREADRLLKEAEKKRKEAEREAERQQRECERESEKRKREDEQKADEVKQKRQSITNFFCKPAAKQTPVSSPLPPAACVTGAHHNDSDGTDAASVGHAAGGNASDGLGGSDTVEANRHDSSLAPAFCIYVRDGRRVVPFFADEHTSVATSSKSASCAGSPQYMLEVVDWLSGLKAAPRPLPPAGLKRACRRERRIKTPASSAPWLWAHKKLLSFHEDVRPPYLGTFTHGLPRPSESAFNLTKEWAPPSDACTASADTGRDYVTTLSRCGCLGDGSVSWRRPFGKDATLFNYEVDSEAEWEPEPEGEELLSEEEPDGEELPSESDEEMDDDFIVPDDEMEVVCADGAKAAPAPSRSLHNRLTPMLILSPLLSGGAIPMPTTLHKYSVELFDEPQPAAATAGMHCTSASSQSADAYANSSTTPTGRSGVRGPGAKVVPADQLPRLVALVNGSDFALPKMIAAFLAESPGASKIQVDKQIRAIAEYRKRPGDSKSRWHVAPHVLAELGIVNTPEGGSSNAPVISTQATDVLNPVLRSFLSGRRHGEAGAPAATSGCAVECSAEASSAPSADEAVRALFAREDEVPVVSGIPVAAAQLEKCARGIDTLPSAA